MAKFKFKLKKNWKNILAVGLTVVLGIGAIFGITRLVENDDGLKKISPAYTVGGLGADGKYVDTEESIYTKNAFECQGLKITPDFDNCVSYQVFFYDQNEQYLESTASMTEFYEGTPLLAKYARIEITPNEDEKVSWYEVNKYAKQLTVEVAKKQDFIDVRTIDLFPEGEHVLYKSLIREGDTNNLIEETREANGYVKIDVSNISRLRIYIDGGDAIQNYFIDENGQLVGDPVNLFDGISEYVLSVPENAKYLVANYLIGSEYSIFQLL